jgi:hypothetical protein
VISVDFEAHMCSDDLETVNTVEVGQAPRRTLCLGRDRGSREVPELAKSAFLDHPSQPDDAHAIAQRFDLGQDVAGE